MRTLPVAVGILFLTGWLTLLSQDQPRPVKVATDPAHAGPDFPVQGEYIGETANQQRLGAEVVALGDGKFLVNFLPGGLRGQGGEYAKRIEAQGQRDGFITRIRSKDGKWSATIENGRMLGTTADGTTFELKRIIRESKTLGQKPPPNAVVLFDGSNADNWEPQSHAKLVDGALLGNDIASKQKFRDHKLHLEFRLSFMPYARGQARSNSGVYIQHRYEIQVLDSFGLRGANNECGGIYGQFAPLVNMCYPPLQWQTYDVEFRAARFDSNGKKISNAIISVWHNGVLIHDKVELKGPTGGGQPENDSPGPLFLQSHGGQVRYRNIWVVEMSSN
ncbi:MAG: DUF1080 domain-containing protein [Gemmatales bacterium]|nr:DUF1080 domain-containing protein [Gemmatales bacterium]MDW7993766.1 DUF1080 domain-containing protein [Gemmatales bacterium]